jgi:hypothetical protein
MIRAQEDVKRIRKLIEASRRGLVIMIAGVMLGL